jgi:hypothetical protein
METHLTITQAVKNQQTLDHWEGRPVIKTYATVRFLTDSILFKYTDQHTAGQ